MNMHESKACSSLACTVPEGLRLRRNDTENSMAPARMTRQIKKCAKAKTQEGQLQAAGTTRLKFCSFELCGGLAPNEGPVLGDSRNCSYCCNSAQEVIISPRLACFPLALFRMKIHWRETKLCEKRSPFFWGPLVLAHFPQAPKTVPFSVPNFGQAGYHALHFGDRFWNHKICAQINNQCQMQSDNSHVGANSICSTAAKKQVQACCTYTLILTHCSNCHLFIHFAHFLAVLDRCRQDTADWSFCQCCQVVTGSHAVFMLFLKRL